MSEYVSTLIAAKKMGLPHGSRLINSWIERAPDDDPLPHIVVKHRGKGRYLVRMDAVYDWLDRRSSASIRKVPTTSNVMHRICPALWQAVRETTKTLTELGLDPEDMPAAHADQQAEAVKLWQASVKHAVEKWADEVVEDDEEYTSVMEIYQQNKRRRR